MKSSIGQLTLADTVIRALMRRGVIGTFTHASVESRHHRRQGNGSALSSRDQLLAAFAEDLARLRNILRVEPLSVMCRMDPGSDRRDAIAEAMILFPNGAHVHYGARMSDEPVEHEAWFEGSKGVLWTNGRSAWWRRRGWPRFAPLFIGPSLASRPGIERVKPLIEGLNEPGRAPSAGNSDTELISTLAILRAAVESDRTRTIIQVGSDPRPVGRDEGRPSVSGAL